MDDELDLEVEMDTSDVISKHPSQPNIHDPNTTQSASSHHTEISKIASQDTASSSSTTTTTPTQQNTWHKSTDANTIQLNGIHPASPSHTAVVTSSITSIQSFTPPSKPISIPIQSSTPSHLLKSYHEYYQAALIRDPIPSSPSHDDDDDDILPFLSTIVTYLHARIRELPIVDFYVYMFQINKSLFISTICVNYLLPLFLEAMPWYLSRRKLSKVLRDSRNTLQHRLIAAEPFQHRLTVSFVFFSLIYALLQTAEQNLRTRVQLENRLVVKRLVMERILYSEIGALQSKYLELYGESVRTDQLETQVFSDISETLNLFNHIIPSIIRGTYTFLLSAYELWGQRAAIDILAIARPTIVGLINEIIQFFRERLILDQQTAQLQRNNMAMLRVISNIVDGLSEIQVNNMQRYQLARLDQVSSEEVDTKQGMTTFANNVYRIVNNRSVFDFATEVYVVHLVMKRRNIDHETYRKIQNDIDYVTRLFHRVYTLARQGYTVLDTQNRLIDLLNLPSFLNEQKELPQLPEEGLDFRFLRIRRLRFHYAPNLPPALDIGGTPDTPFTYASLDSRLANNHMPVLSLPPSPHKEEKKEIDVTSTTLDVPTSSLVKSISESTSTSTSTSTTSSTTSSPSHPTNHDRSDATTPLHDDVGEIVIERGKTYCIVGQNRSGKSTLMQILCKLYAPEEGYSDITLNGVPFESIPRTGLRRLISYVAQRPFIFPGSIEENIRVGQNTYSAIEVEEAAENAGVFIFEKPKPIAAQQKSTSIFANREVAPLKPWESGRVKNAIVTGASWAYQRALEMHTYIQRKMGHDENAPSTSSTSSTTTTPSTTSIIRDRAPSHATSSSHHHTHSIPCVCHVTSSPTLNHSHIHLPSCTLHGYTSPPAIFSSDPTAIPDDHHPIPSPPPSSSDHTCDTLHLLPHLHAHHRWHATTLEMDEHVNTDMVTDSQGTDAEPEINTTSEPTSTSTSTSASMSTSESTPQASLPSFLRQRSTHEIDFRDFQNGSVDRSSHPVLMMETEEGGTNLSGGFAQSVALARIFLKKDAQVVILDEALGQMDSIKKKEMILPRLLAFVKQHNMTLIIISHDLQSVCPAVDHVFVLERGHLVQQGSHSELMARRAQPYVRLFGSDDWE